MKIVLVLHFKLDMDAGAAGVLLTLAHEFRLAGHRVAIVSHDDIAWLPLLLRNLVFPFYVAAKLFLAHGDADVIEGGTGDCWIYYLLRRRSRKTLRVTFSQGLYRPLHERLMRKRATRTAAVSWRYWLFHGSLELWQEAWSLQLADLVYVLNADESRYVTQSLTIPAERVRTVRNGLAAYFIRRAESLRGRAVPQHRTGLVQIGSWEERKGIRVSVAATTCLLSAQPDLTMLYLGTKCPAELSLAAYPGELRSRVTVIPQFRNTDLPRLLERCHIFLMPSTYEGFGIAPLEAMACGVVPIVTNIAGPAEYVIHEHNGLTIPVDDQAALERAITRLVEDDGLYARLQAGALATAVTFGWREVACSRLEDYRNYPRGRPAHRAATLGLSSRFSE